MFFCSTAPPRRTVAYTDFLRGRRGERIRTLSSPVVSQSIARIRAQVDGPIRLCPSAPAPPSSGAHMRRTVVTARQPEPGTVEPCPSSRPAAEQHEDTMEPAGLTNAPRLNPLPGVVLTTVPKGGRRSPARR